MKKRSQAGLLRYARILVCCALAAGAGAREEDIFEFFEEEAKTARVVTASRLPLTERQSPATVYVVAAEDIRTSGAKTLWEALRGVPGVSVMLTRTFYGEVSIRGLDKVLSNRTLVLLDGKTVLNGMFDTTFWEGIPVALEEIDRIEVVQGPASALYGANAINGVINILTQTPEQLGGGTATYTFGERSTHLASAVYGERRGPWRYKTSASYRATNRFENPGRRASEVGLIHAFAGYDLPGKAGLSVSGGLARHNTQLSTGAGGAVFYDGASGFLRADFRRDNTRMRAFWNRSRPYVRGFDVQNSDPALNFDAVDVTLEHSFSPFNQNRLVAGGAFRRNTMDSNIYTPNRIHQTLWALFFEDAWYPFEQLTLVTSGRLDRHSLTGWVFSPRGSVVFSPTPQHVFRLSAGTSFRNPTLSESYISFAQSLQTPFNLPVQFEIVGEENLEPEHMRMVELAHEGRLGNLKTSAAGFHYRLRNIISGTFPVLVPEALPELRLRSRFANLDGETRAWGGELSLNFAPVEPVEFSAGYAYLHSSGTLDGQVAENGGPAHKLSGSFRIHRRGLRAGLQAFWVDETRWSDADFATQTFHPTPVESYGLLNAYLAYAFQDRLRGLELGLHAFNLTDHAHYEILPARSDVEPGQHGERIRRRITATVSFRF